MNTVAAWSAGGFSFAFGLVVFRSLASLLFGRLATKEAQVDAGNAQLYTDFRTEIDRLSDECVSLRGRADATEEELRHCRDEHAKCEARVKQLEATFQGYGDAKQIAQLQAAADRRKDKE